MKKITLLMICLLAGFFANAQYATMAIVGDAVGGWPGEPGNPGPVDLHQMTSTDGINWTMENIIIGSGSLKFRAQDSWSTNWGAPSGQAGLLAGTAVSDSQTNFSPAGGIYNVTFNSTTLAYAFTLSNIYPLISLVGPAVGGWDSDIDMSTIDGVHYTSTALHLNAGAVKWRQNHNWNNNWGATAFPSGTAVAGDTGAIDVPDGTFNITFNLTTLEYNFAYPTVALVGSATPTGWPANTPGEVDAQQLSTTDGITYHKDAIVLINGAGKFRMNNNWNVQWGASTTPSFPNGVGTQNGTDITMTAGTWSIDFNRETGVYGFTDILGVTTLVTPTFKVYPNPTQNSWNFTASNGNVKSVSIADITGKVVMIVSADNKIANVDGSQLSSGVYFAKVATENAVSTVKLIRN
ncbi:T9SS type A sorting domain-containing protein [Flavobacterium sp. 3HN19-14]|uniref:T9SS type A sorting domain-containing protein n=1 Tax=Flavobacterium sp. 3HN19-14 TaxID=3448133 RepID=UPI003EDF86F2